VLRAHQRDGYAVLMQASAAAIIELARDPRYVGGTVAVLAVLHTWTQQLAYHPHVHCLVTGGGVSANGRDWHPARGAFLVPHKALAKLVRGKLKAALANKRPDLVAPRAAWTKPWVVHIAHWGEGAEAVLRYLARYVFRTAITNTRIVGLGPREGGERSVTFRYKHRKSSCWQTCSLPGHEFMRRFLQHVLPPGLHKVRYSGLWHHSKRHLAAQARLLPPIASRLRMLAMPRISAASFTPDPPFAGKSCSIVISFDCPAAANADQFTLANPSRPTP
jgi:hypothetical protein